MSSISSLSRTALPMPNNIKAYGRTFITPMTREEYECPAFKALTPAELRVYMEMRSRYNGRNNGKISMSGGQAGELCHMTRSTGYRALNGLIKWGFIEKVTPARIEEGRRLATEYELTAISMTPCQPNELRVGRCLFLERQSSEIDEETTMKVISLEDYRVA